MEKGRRRRGRGGGGADPAGGDGGVREVAPARWAARGGAGEALVPPVAIGVGEFVGGGVCLLPVDVRRAEPPRRASRASRWILTRRLL
jgi:hypothetical protein